MDDFTCIDECPEDGDLISLGGNESKDLDLIPIQLIEITNNNFPIQSFNEPINAI